jgi:hypothetical protein
MFVLTIDFLSCHQNYERWHENFYLMRDHVLFALRYPLQVIAGFVIYHKERYALYLQGTMRLRTPEIDSLRLEIWDSINTLLAISRSKATVNREVGEKVFWVWGGEKPSEADATLFGFVAAVLNCQA